MARIAEIARRSLIPTMAVGFLESNLVDRVRARALRASRRAIRGEFYFAFDDPYSAVCFAAVCDLADRKGIEIEFFPVVREPVASDLTAMRKQYEVVDAARLSRRFSRAVTRSEPIAQEFVTILPAWAEEAKNKHKLRPFAGAVLHRLWSNDELPDYGELFAIYHREVGHSPPKTTAVHRAAVRRNMRLLQERGHWTTPSLRIESKWFFAHERMPQVRDYCASLGVL